MAEQEQDLFDQVIKETAADRPAFRQAPAGDYLVTVQSVKFVKANNGRQGIELAYTMIEPMHNEDMVGVTLAKCRLSDTMWISEKSIGIVQERLARISKDVVGNTLRDVADILPGNDVVVNISHETANRDGTPLNTPRLKVERYYSVDWYMNNKRAA
ncbi:hypothetical protein UFOVP735_56 [uncultured Caudovirales phage]|uniref:Uncharacterized protein n=1 Tax=uncultured Caudovirales phage TaxID=2100421 RepID=A0A6J7X299_9CAUD|nr:hypothetical protein UFOVP735_56 [uncultured Caudovirales phage]